MAKAPDPATPAEDLLSGAQVIADFLFGDPDPRKRRRRLYHVASSMKGAGRPPVFKIGATLCARRSSLLSWLAEREQANTAA